MEQYLLTEQRRTFWCTVDAGNLQRKRLEYERRVSPGVHADEAFWGAADTKTRIHAGLIMHSTVLLWVHRAGLLGCESKHLGVATEKLIPRISYGLSSTITLRPVVRAC